MVARTVTKYIRAGLAACHIEDQVQTKRCGHLMGKQVVSREEFVTRIRAAVIARDSVPGGSDFVSVSAFVQPEARADCMDGRLSLVARTRRRSSVWRRLSTGSSSPPTPARTCASLRV